MWAATGFLIAAAAGILAVLAVGRRGSAQLRSHPWMLYETAKLHVAIIGNLAGFAFTGVVLVVTLARDRPNVVDASLDNVVVMLLVAYLFWVGSAFLISFLPNVDTTDDLVPRVHFSLATTIEFRTVFLSWFALLPLLEANGLGRLAPVLYFLLPASLFTGSVVVAMVSDGLGLLPARETFLSAAIGALLALAYAGIVAFVFPAARSLYSPLILSVVIFCVNFVGFDLAALTPLSARYPGIKRFFERHGRKLVIADMQLTMLSLTFLWLSVVKVI
jgi:hypothetical protein